jgi:hypothetical protein
MRYFSTNLIWLILLTAGLHLLIFAASRGEGQGSVIVAGLAGTLFVGGLRGFSENLKNEIVDAIVREQRNK